MLIKLIVNKESHLLNNGRTNNSYYKFFDYFELHLINFELKLICFSAIIVHKAQPKSM